MKFPNKINSYKESILCKLPILLKYLSNNSYKVSELYLITRNHFKNIEEYIDTIDCLYILGKIKYDDEKDMINYVN